ncbi:MAG: acyl-ACP--UDP-N-acetylglucosamine O-acyltransferase [Phycisphaerales bacterium]
MPKIHPTAIVPDSAKLADDVEIGPYCVLEGDVTLGPGVRLVAHVCLMGPITIGARTSVWPYACLGLPPQDVKFTRDSVTQGVVIGEDCILREHMTIHAATQEHPTRVGDRCFLMGTTHVAHDAILGNDVTFVNGAGVAGHTVIGDKVILSGSCIVHQFVRLGRLAMMSGGTGVSADVPPFCVVNERQRLGGVNLVGMRRSGFDRSEITAVRGAFRDVFRRSLTKPEMLEILDERAARSDAIGEMAEFVRTAKRPICPGRDKPPRLGVASEPEVSEA